MNIVSCESLIKIVMHQDDNVFTYDTMNRIDTMLFTLDGQTALFDYAYDLAGRQTQSALTLNNVADRTINIEYDYLGRALSAELTGNALNDILAELDYNAVGALTDVRRFEWDDTDELYNLIAQSQYQYNARNQITNITHADASNVAIAAHSYSFSPDGNITQYTNSIDGTVNYTNDFLGQLIGADYSNLSIHDESYQYDLNGNRELVTNANGDLVVYSTGTNNELTSDGAYTYAYDAEGNRISKTNAAGTERELYEWDYRNRLESVTKQEYNATTQEWETVQIVEYAYDYNNVLIRKVLDVNGDGVSDSKTIFLPENYQTAVQLDDADLSDSTYETVSHRYLWTPGQQDKLLADVTPTETLWTLTDHLGTVRDIIQNTPSGLVVPAHIIYDAYGNVLSCKDANGTDVSTPVLFGFTGKYFDSDTQLQNNVNRWYDATTGRWLSTDPIGFNGNDTNLYRYVGNITLMNLDCLGNISDSVIKHLLDPYQRTVKNLVNGFPALGELGIKRTLQVELIKHSGEYSDSVTVTNPRTLATAFGWDKPNSIGRSSFNKLNDALAKMQSEGKKNCINVEHEIFAKIYYSRLQERVSATDVEWRVRYSLILFSRLTYTNQKDKNDTYSKLEIIFSKSGEYALG